MLNTLREKTRSIPVALALVENTELWSFCYASIDGVKKMQYACRDTEWAFNQMRADLARSSHATGGITDVRVVQVRALP